jgi:hypothetical protein
LSGLTAFRRQQRAEINRRRETGRQEVSMRIGRAIVHFTAFFWLLSTTLTAQSWILPQGMAVKDAGPRTYRFIVDHTVADTTGNVVQRQRVTGDYTRGLSAQEALWRNVTVAESNGPAELSVPGQKREFMEGFRYRIHPGWLDDSMKPDFFKGFPPTAVFERNLVWDTGMLEMFGQDQFERLKLNVPYRLMSSKDVHMPGIGTFQNRDVVLTWTGRSWRNGTECGLIEYRAFFNPLEIVNGAMTLQGRSHYWGEIWVSLSTKQIEYATLYEDVLGELKLGPDPPRTISVFRSGIFEPITVAATAPR